jgi:CheY-like chemotaxis protein/HPt (histidine-containing phosphotransfer) domain-containing protein
VVEDDEVSRTVAACFLETMGHKVTVANDGAQAIEAVERGDFDAVLMDISLPRMSGIEATRRIRGLAEARKSQVPIIAMSAHVFRTEIDEHLKAGMDAFIGKPISPAGLERVLAQALLGEAAGEQPVDAEPAEQPWVDCRALIEDLQALGPERMQKLVDLFLESTPQRMTAIADAVRQGQLETLEFAAHGLKSAATSLGLMRLADRLESMETAAAGGQAQTVADIHRDLAAVYETSVAPCRRPGGSCARLLPSRPIGREQITFSVYRDDVLRRLGIGLDLAAQPAHQHVDGAVGRIPLAVRDVGQEPVAGHHHMRVAHQRRQAARIRPGSGARWRRRRP